MSKKRNWDRVPKEKGSISNYTYHATLVEDDVPDYSIYGKNVLYPNDKGLIDQIAGLRPGEAVFLPLNSKVQGHFLGKRIRSLCAKHALPRYDLRTQKTNEGYRLCVAWGDTRLQRLLEAWVSALGDRSVPTCQLFELLDEFPSLKAIVNEIAPLGETQLGKIQLGHFLKDNAGKTAGNLQLMRGGKHHQGGVMWRVQR